MTVVKARTSRRCLKPASWRSRAAERLSELLDTLLSFFYPSQELLALHRDMRAARLAKKIIVSLYPGYRFLSPMGAFGARQPDLLRFEHSFHRIRFSNCITMQGGSQ